MVAFPFPNSGPRCLAGIALGGAIAIGLTLLSQWSGSRRPKKVTPPAEEKKKKVIINPPWAITKAGYLKATRLSRKQLKELLERRPPKEWNTVIFFPTPLPDRPVPYGQLQKYFQEARVSLHICMYLCSIHDMSNLILDKYVEGLAVLIITDYDTWTAHNNVGFKILAGKGIEVRLNTSDHLMHNKFSIIDGEGVLTGSLNWTKQGVRTNNENVAVTTNHRIVGKYVQEFDRLWEESRSVHEFADAGRGSMRRFVGTTTKGRTYRRHIC